MAMNLNNLRIFINVVDSGNITRTEEVLFISLPAVSKAVRTIEEAPGVSLQKLKSSSCTQRRIF